MIFILKSEKNNRAIPIEAKDFESAIGETTIRIARMMRSASNTSVDLRISLTGLPSAQFYCGEFSWYLSEPYESLP